MLARWRTGAHNSMTRPRLLYGIRNWRKNKQLPLVFLLNQFHLLRRMLSHKKAKPTQHKGAAPLGAPIDNCPLLLSTMSDVPSDGSNDSDCEVAKLVTSRKVRVSAVREGIINLFKYHGALADETNASRTVFVPNKKVRAKSKAHLHVALMLRQLFELSNLLKFDLKMAADLKQHLNETRYPTELCADVHTKSDEYAFLTGLSKESVIKKMTKEVDGNECEVDYFDSPAAAIQTVSWIEKMLVRSMKFVSDRGWDYVDAEPGNIFLALGAEMGELAEILQFHGEVRTHINKGEIGPLASELSDVLIYLIRFSDSLRLLDDALKELAKVKKKSRKSVAAKEGQP